MIRKYKSGDVWQVEVQRNQEEEFTDVADGFDNIVSYTLIGDGGRVLAVFGFDKGNEGIGSVYALLGKDCGGKMTELFRFMQKELQRDMKLYGCHAVQATVKRGFAEGGRFILMLGFSYKGILPQFYKGNDYLLFEKEEK